MYFLLTSYTLIMLLKVLRHFIMKIKNFMKYFKERVLKYLKIYMKFLNISKWNISSCIPTCSYSGMLLLQSAIHQFHSFLEWAPVPAYQPNSVLDYINPRTRRSATAEIARVVGWSLHSVKCKLGHNGCSRSSKVINFCPNRTLVWDFLLQSQGNRGPVSHRFRVMTAYWSKFLLSRESTPFWRPR